MLRDPVLEQRVGHADRKRPPFVRNKSRGLEPRIKAVTVHLRLDAGQDFVPDIARIHNDFPTFASAPPGEPARNSVRHVKNGFKP